MQNKMKLKKLFKEPLIIKLAVLALLLVISELCTAQVRLVKAKVSDKISMKLPENFFPMSEQELRTKYLSNKVPLAAYISYDKHADFGINISNSRWLESDVEMLKNFYKVNIQTLHTDVKFLKEEIIEINKQVFVVFEFVSLVADEDKKLKSTAKPIKRYHYIQYAIVNNKALVFNFSAPAEQMEMYRNIVPEMMGTIKIKKTL